MGPHAHYRADLAGSVQNPYLFSGIEEACKRLEAWRERRAPGSTAAMRQMMDQSRTKFK